MVVDGDKRVTLQLNALSPTVLGCICDLSCEEVIRRWRCYLHGCVLILLWVNGARCLVGCRFGSSWVEC